MQRDVREIASPARIGAAIIIAAIAVIAVQMFLPTLDAQHVVVEHTESSADATASDVEDAQTVTVYVTGAVSSPGVYVLDLGSRMVDAIKAAGGMADDADAEHCNLAEEIFDGEHIHIPTANAITDAQDAEYPSDQRININHADAEALQTLRGIGAATALNIIAEREANGPFQTIDDLTRVSGVGQKKLDAIREEICV